MHLLQLIEEHLDTAVYYEAEAGRRALYDESEEGQEEAAKLLAQSRRIFQGALMLEARLFASAAN